jgi:hypothetical protein
MVPIQHLSDELLLHVFAYVLGDDIKGLGVLARVCFRWRELCNTVVLRRRFFWELVCAGQIAPLTLRRDWLQSLHAHRSCFVTVTHPHLEIWDCKQAPLRSSSAIQAVPPSAPSLHSLSSSSSSSSSHSSSSSASASPVPEAQHPHDHHCQHPHDQQQQLLLDILLAPSTHRGPGLRLTNSLAINAAESLGDMEVGNIQKVCVSGAYLFGATANSSLCAWDVSARPAVLAGKVRVPCHPGNLVDMDAHAVTLAATSAGGWGEPPRLFLWRIGGDQEPLLAPLVEKALFAVKAAALVVTRQNMVYLANASARGSLTILDASGAECRTLSGLQLSKGCIVAMAMTDHVLATAVLSNSGSSISLWDIRDVLVPPMCVADLPCAATHIAVNSQAVFAAGEGIVTVWHLSKPEAGTGRRVVTKRGGIRAPWAPGKAPLVACSEELLLAFFDSHIHLWPIMSLS